MENNNPYSASATVAQDHVTSDSGQLAGRGRRLGGAIIDSIILACILFPIAYYVFDQNFATPTMPSASYSIKMAIIGFIVYVLVNGAWLNSNGQTVGKKLLGMRIVRTDGSKADIQHILLRRVLPIYVLQAVPLINMLAIVDVLFIFGDKHQCVHDLIADTKVVMV